jgi:hypothetical protein
VGQRTLPPDQHDPPRPRDHARRVDDASDVDQPPTAPPAPPTRERPHYRGIPLDGATGQLHRAVDQLEADTVPYTYYLKVTASRQPAQAPPGRRTPQPLHAPREELER